MIEGRVYLGKGLKFPIELTNGRGLEASDLDLINQSIQLILGTAIGTRLFLPEFGSRLTELIFEPNDEVLHDLLTLFITEALANWEKRIKVIRVNCSRSDETTTLCDIQYRVLASNEVESYVYPFYTRKQF